MTLFRTLALCAALFTTPALAGDTKHDHSGHGSHHGMAKIGDLTVSEAYARATLGKAPNSAAYLTITSAGGADRLINAASPAAGAVELHTTVNKDDVMQMLPVEAVEIPAGGMAELAPGGAHVMLIGLTEPLKNGATIPLTLTFETSGKIDLTVPVRKVKHGGHNHGGHTHGSGG